MWSWQIGPPETAQPTASSASVTSTASSPALASNNLNAQNTNASAGASAGHSPAQLPASSGVNPYPHVRLRVIDNDTCEEFPSFLGCTPPRYFPLSTSAFVNYSFIFPFSFSYLLGDRRYQPNQLGYTIMAECKCPFRVPASRSRLRVISTNAKFCAEPEPVRCVYEFEDSYHPNQASPLFRNILRVKERAQVAIHVGVPPGNGNVHIKLQVCLSIHLSFFLLFLALSPLHFCLLLHLSLPSYLLLTLPQVFDKGEEIYATEGKRCCIIPVLYLYPTQKKEEEYVCTSPPSSLSLLFFLFSLLPFSITSDSYINFSTNISSKPLSFDTPHLKRMILQELASSTHPFIFSLPPSFTPLSSSTFSHS